MSISPDAPAPPPPPPPPRASAYYDPISEVPQRRDGYPLLLPFGISAFLLTYAFVGAIDAQEKLLMVSMSLGVQAYFLPTYLAYRKRKQKVNALAIFIVNLFLGWTFIGWVASLVWACTTSHDDMRARAYWNRAQ